MSIDVGEPLTVIQHAYTHFRITLHAFLCTLAAGNPACLECEAFQWASIEQIRALPMAVTDRKIARALESWLEAKGWIP